MGEADIFHIHSVIVSFYAGVLSLIFHWPLGAFDWEQTTSKTIICIAIETNQYGSYYCGVMNNELIQETLSNE